MELGEREIIYLSLHCHHQNDFCIKMGSDESDFNVSVGSGGQSHRTGVHKPQPFFAVVNTWILYAGTIPKRISM